MRLAIALLSISTAFAQGPSFTRDVQPVLNKYCIGCHATSVKMGQLDLGTYEGLRKGGNHGEVVVPGKPDESRIYTMVSGKTKPVMPMDGTKLADGELEILRAWVEAGARGPAPGEAPAALSNVAKIVPRVPVKPQIFAMAWQPGTSIVALAGWQQVRLHDTAAKKDIAALTGHADVVRSVAFSKDGKLLAAAGGICGKEGAARIWDTAAKTERIAIKGHSDCIYAVAFSPDGKQLATSSYDKLIKLWDVATGKEVRTLKDHIDAVYALAFTPDGKRLISGAADRTVKVWEVATGERLYTLSEPADAINSIALNTAGTMVAAGGYDKTIRIWTLGEKSAKLENHLIAHEDAILKVAFSPDGKTLVSSSADKTIKLFRVPDLTELKVIPNQPDWVYGIEFSPDGKSFAAGRYDGSLSLYDSSTQEMRTASR